MGLGLGDMRIYKQAIHGKIFGVLEASYINRFPEEHCKYRGQKA